MTVIQLFPARDCQRCAHAVTFRGRIHCIEYDEEVLDSVYAAEECPTYLDAARDAQAE